MEPGKCHPDPEKVTSLRNYPTPQTRKDIKRFLSLVGFYRRFIPEFSSHAKHLTDLLKKNSVFDWSDKAQKRFEYLKFFLSNHTEVFPPNLNDPFIIQTNASDHGLGAILIQVRNNERQPIGFASRSLRVAEINYSTSEKECLAVIWAIEKFRGFVEYTHFTIETDHQALSWLQRLKEPAGRLTRWFMTLQSYQFDVKYRPGDSVIMRPTDALSRIDESREGIALLFSFFKIAAIG